MTRINLVTMWLLAITTIISLGIALTGGYPARPEIDGIRAQAYAVITAPMFFPVLGALLSVPVLAACKKLASAQAGKARMVLAIGTLSGPALALWLQVFMPLEAFGYLSDNTTDLLLLVAHSVLVIAIGNYIITAPFGASFGMRNRWTLTNEVVWSRTHRFIGQGLVVGELIGAPVAALVDLESALFYMAAMIIAILVSGYLYARWLSQVPGRQNPTNSQY